MRHACPVCGFADLFDVPRTKAGGGSYEICEACGFQFGVTDDDRGFSYEAWRLRWIALGSPWDSASIRQAPPAWDPSTSLRSLPSAAQVSTTARYVVGDRVRLTSDWDGWRLKAGTLATVTGVRDEIGCYELTVDGGPGVGPVLHVGPTDVEPVDRRT